MARSALESGGKTQHFRVVAAEGNDVGDARLAFGQRSGLVEGDGVDLAKRLQHRAALDQQAAACAGRERGGDRSRRGDDQRAGAADQQDREPLVDPRAPRRTEGERRDGGHEGGDDDHARRVIAREAVDEAFRRSLRFLCLLDEADDAGDGVVLRRGGHADAQRLVAIDRSGKYRIVGLLENGRALARDRCLVDRAFAVEHDPVGGNPVARPDKDGRALRQAVGGNFGCRPVVIDAQRRLGDEVAQRRYARPRPSGGHAFEQFSEEKQEDHDGRLLRRAERHRADSGDSHQHLDRERRSGEPRAHDRPPRDGHEADQHRQREEPDADPRKHLRHGGCDTKRDAGRDRDADLAVAIPRPGGWFFIVRVRRDRFGFAVGMAMIVCMVVLMLVVVPAASCAGGFRQGFAVGEPAGAVAERTDALLQLVEVGRRIVAHAHAAGCHRNPDILDPLHPASGSVDLGSTARAIHAVHLEPRDAGTVAGSRNVAVVRGTSVAVAVVFVMLMRMRVIVSMVMAIVVAGVMIVMRTPMRMIVAAARFACRFRKLIFHCQPFGTVAKCTHAFFQLAEVGASIVVDGHAAGRHRDRHVLDTPDPVHRALDLRGAACAVHAVHLVAGLDRFRFHGEFLSFGIGFVHSCGKPTFYSG